MEIIVQSFLVLILFFQNFVVGLSIIVLDIRLKISIYPTNWTTERHDNFLLNIENSIPGK